MGTLPYTVSLRGEPVDSIAELKALVPHDGEVRRVGTVEPYSYYEFIEGAVSGDEADNGATGFWILEAAAETKAIFAHKVASGVLSGSSVSGVWTKLPINAVVQNNISGASLATNVITLPAGNYEARGFASFYRVNRAQAKIIDTTNSVDLILGSSIYSVNASGSSSSTSLIEGEFIISSSTDMEIQYYASSDRSSNGLGVDANTGSDELYSQIVFEKKG